MKHNPPKYTEVKEEELNALLTDIQTNVHPDQFQIILTELQANLHPDQFQTIKYVFDTLTWLQSVLMEKKRP